VCQSVKITNPTTPQKTEAAHDEITFYTSNTRSYRSSLESGTGLATLLAGAFTSASEQSITFSDDHPVVY